MYKLFLSFFRHSESNKHFFSSGRRHLISFTMTGVILLSTVTVTLAQELNCTIKVITPQLQTADPKVFEDMQKAVYEFMNNRRWTADIFSQQERIECSMLINITKELASDKYQAQVTIQSNRPVYNSSYNSTLLNLVDKEWTITYTQYQPLEYNDNASLSELTSLLAYYAYIIIGMDYDSFSPKGGTPYFQKAQNIVNMSQNSDSKGWKSFESTRNRYWLVENILNQKYDNIRLAVYKYHREGMDKMYDNPDEARKVISDCFSMLSKVHEEYPNSMFMQNFFSAKSEEIINIFSKATPQEKTTAVNTLVKLDASNSQKYQAILKSN